MKKLLLGLLLFPVLCLADSNPYTIRKNINLYATAFASGATTIETIFTLTFAPNVGATSTLTTYPITNAKHFRITSLILSTVGNAVATAETTTFSLRVNASGACVVTSTPILTSFRLATTAVAGAIDRIFINPTDGIEVNNNGGGIQFCVTANSVFVANAPTWDVEISGYEY